MSERKDQDGRGWDALETEDEERLYPAEQFEKEIPPILPQVRWRYWLKTAAWIILASVPVALAFALVLLLGN